MIRHYNRRMKLAATLARLAGTTILLQTSCAIDSQDVANATLNTFIAVAVQAIAAALLA